MMTPEEGIDGVMAIFNNNIANCFLITKPQKLGVHRLQFPGCHLFWDGKQK